MLVEQLVKIRKEKNIKQKNLATDLGISATHLCMIEKGDVSPSLKIVEKMVDKLDYTIALIRK